MTNVQLISEAKVREFTSLNRSVDSALIVNCIRTAQDYYLQSVIGTLLYERLLNDVQNGTLAGDYKYLLDNYIQDFLLYAAYYEILEEIFLRPRNNGLIKPTGGENSVEIDLDTYNVKRQSVENKLTYYNERLTNYILEEDGKFPELNQADKLYEQEPDYASKYKNPFVVSDTRLAEFSSKMGIPLYDRRYKQYPWATYYGTKKNLPK
jgi:hypothetical protein